MTDANAANTNWMDAWLESQRAWLSRWHAASVEQRTDAMRAGMETLRQQLDPQSTSPEALNLAHSFQQLLHAGLHASGEWTRMRSDTGAGPETSEPDWMTLPPLGPAREQQLLWQNLLRAQLEYQIRLQALMGEYAKVFAESLDAVPGQVASRAAQGRPVAGLRDLYEIWIECGEAAFARVAADEVFVSAQAACGNALSRLKLAQAALLEQWLKALDLPTRSELNGLHQRLRDLQSRVDELSRSEKNAKPDSAPPRRTRRKHDDE